MNNRIVIAGGGAAGLAAAVFAAEAGLKPEIFEKNEKTGKKLYITGKGRCNFTNVCSPEEFLENVVTNRRFLYSAIYGFTPEDTVAFFERLGVRTKVERGRRAFPVSDRSSDITDALRGRLKELGVPVHLNSPVEKLPDPAELGCPVIIACGGLSYPSTGSTGDGLRFAKEAGLKVSDTRPALVPVNVTEQYVKDLQGLSLKNAGLTIKDGKKTVYSGFGELLFTHFGVSGPLILSASSIIGRYLEKNELKAFIDLKPALDEEKLEARILREFADNKNKTFKNAAGSLFPAKLRPVMTELSGIDAERAVNSITREERRKFVSLIKNFSFTINSLRGYNEAVITQGGVDVKQIDPGTFECKKIKDLYFIGEVLDVDAMTGGYNLQIAWSTAYAAVSGILAKRR